MTMYYIHGYNSSPQSATAMDMKKVFPGILCLTYCSDTPHESIQQMLNIIKKTSTQNDVIIASSIGAWYASEIAKTITADLILYNPSTCPQISLKKYSISQKICDLYSDICVDHGNQITVILSTDDAVIPYTVAEVKYRNLAKIVYTTGGHRMTHTNIMIIQREVAFSQNQITP